jgi:hypothetical protein
MPNNKINVIAGVLLPAVVIIMTAVLFFMFRPVETTSLFYLNLGYTIILELIFFGYLNVLYSKTREFSTPLFAIFGVYSMYYIIVGVIWMLLYSLALSYFLPIKYHIAVLIVLTLLWIIVSVLTAQTDANYKATTDKLRAEGQTLTYYAQKISLLSSRYEKLCMERGIVYQTDSNNRTILDRLKVKIGYLTPNVFRSETACMQLNTLLDKCESIIEETESASADKLSESERKMLRFVNNAIDELDMLKNITRG